MPTLFTMRPTVPKRLIDTDKLNRRLQRLMDDAIKQALKELKDATATWHEKPQFTVVQTAWTRRITTTNKVFTWLDEGTKRHTISPKKASVGFIQFQQGYNAKTTPLIMGSQAGGSFGSVRRKKQVVHPGIEARKFSETVTENMQKELEQEVEDAIRSALGG